MTFFEGILGVVIEDFIWINAPKQPGVIIPGHYPGVHLC